MIGDYKILNSMGKADRERVNILCQNTSSRGCLVGL